MEQGPASLSQSYNSEAELTASAHNDSSKQQIYEVFTRNSTLEISTLFYDATDGLAPIEPHHYQSLVETGWADQPIEEVCRIFGSWQNFQEEAAVRRSQKVWERWHHKQELLDQINRDLSNGSIDSRLFKKVDKVVKSMRLSRMTKSGEISYSPDTGILTDENVSPEEMLERYCQYTLAKKYLAGIGKFPSDTKLTNMVLGMFLADGETEAALSGRGFTGEMTKTYPEVSLGSMEVMADSMGIFDYVYPDIRQGMLAEIKRDSGYEENDTAESNKEASAIDYVITAKGKHLIGAAAISAYIEEGHHPADLQQLNDLLINDTLDTVPADTFRNSRELEPEMSNEGALAAGNFIVARLRAVKKPRGVINKKVVRRSNVLNLLPSPDQIASPQRFGSLAAFYTQLDEAAASRNKVFQHWTLDHFAESLKNLGKELGHKPTEREINARASQDPNFPSSSIMQKVDDLRTILEAAGWPNIYNWDIPQYELHGVRFMLANDGMEPTQSAWDFLSKQKKGPSASIIRYKYENGFLEYKTKVKQKHAQITQIQPKGKEVTEQIENDAKAGLIDDGLFKDVSTSSQRIVRYLRFRTLSQLLPFLSYAEKLDLLRDERFFEQVNSHAQIKNLRVIGDPGYLEYLSHRKNLGPNRKAPVSSARPQRSQKAA
jgi:hypothetical protein